MTIYFSSTPIRHRAGAGEPRQLAMPQLSAVVQQVNVQKAVVDHDAGGGLREGRPPQRQLHRKLANVYVLDMLKRVNGAGQAQIMGAQRGDADLMIRPHGAT
jgi:hypothetical protein